MGQARTLLSYAFRPFFLPGPPFGMLAILLWVVMLHASGFLLTAVSTWTGRPPVAGLAPW
jgi:uncharacterized protein involved in response to NO